MTQHDTHGEARAATRDPRPAPRDPLPARSGRWLWCLRVCVWVGGRAGGVAFLGGSGVEVADDRGGEPARRGLEAFAEWLAERARPTATTATAAEAAEGAAAGGGGAHEPSPSCILNPLLSNTAATADDASVGLGSCLPPFSAVIDAPNVAYATQVETPHHDTA